MIRAGRLFKPFNATASSVFSGASLAPVSMKGPRERRVREGQMLLTLALIVFVAWLLGFVGVYTIGSIVHVLLVIALVLFLVGIITGRRTVV